MSLLLPRAARAPQLGVKIARRVAHIFKMDAVGREMRTALGLRAEGKVPSTWSLETASLCTPTAVI